MRFKEYFYSNKDNKSEIFEAVFNKYYAKGYFGNIKKSIIKEQQESWFQKFLYILEDKDIDNLTSVLASRDSLCTREWFSRIYGVDIVEKSKDDIKEIATRVFN